MPTRRIAGQKTLLGRTMHDIRYDAVHDQILVPNPFAQAILVFRGDANGEQPPIRVIQGPQTRLEHPDRLEIDIVHNEIFVPEGDKVLVYPLQASGNVAPIREIRGPDTQMKSIQSVAVDPVRNLLIVGAGRSSDPDGSMLIYNRTDNGNAKPRAVIQGPKTGIFTIHQLQVYSPKGWIVATQPGGRGPAVEPEGIFIGVWSVNDSGDVPPRWKIAGPASTLKKPRGVALDIRNKELIVADMRLNAVLTYYFPEIF